MSIKRTISGMLLATAFAAGATAVQAADAVVAVPKYNPDVVTIDPALSRQLESDALVFEEGFDRVSEVVVVTPDGSRTRSQVRSIGDATVVALDGEALLPPASIEPTRYREASYNVYRVYDCAAVDTQFEWDACEGPKTQ